MGLTASHALELDGMTHKMPGSPGCTEQWWYLLIFGGTEDLVGAFVEVHNEGWDEQGKQPRSSCKGPQMLQKSGVIGTACTKRGA